MPTPAEAKKRVLYLLGEIKRISKQIKVRTYATEAVDQMGFIVLNELVAPGQPGLTAVAISSSEIELTFTAGSGPTPTSFTLNRSTTENGPWTGNLLPGNGLTSPFVNSGLPAESTRFYRLQAFNATAASPYTVANATTLEEPPVVGEFNPAFPRIGYRQGWSGAPTSNASAITDIWGPWAAKYMVGFWTGSRNSTWASDTGTITLATLPAYIKGQALVHDGITRHATNVMVKYTNNMQISTTANVFEYNKCLNESAGSKDWIIRLPNGTPVSAGVNAPATNVLTNYYNPFTQADGSSGTGIPVGGLRYSQWQPRMWWYAATDTGGDWIIGNGKGISEGIWDGAFTDDQSITTGKAATTDGADLNGDGIAESITNATVMAARAQGMVDCSTHWKYLFSTHALGTAKYHLGNITAICSSHDGAGTNANIDTWPTALKQLYHGGMCEELTARSKQYGWGDYQDTSRDGLGNVVPHSGFMGRYWRSMENCLPPELVLFGHETEPVFRTIWGTIGQTAKEPNWITEDGVRKYPGVPTVGAGSNINGMSDYRIMRWAFCSCAQHDGYFTINQETSTWNTNLPWFDEYSGGVGVEQVGYLGYRIGDPPENPYEQGVWVSEFDNGLVIVNPNRNDPNVDYTKTITLPTPGVGKRWKRIQGRATGYTTTSNSGAQDLTVNNGQLIPTNNLLTIREFDGLVLLRVDA